MSSDRKEAAGSSASSPFWSKSYAEFVMDKELMEAKAAVEECYRRRARRAGLEGTLPTGRPMTEREINDLNELLGDGVRSRAKRGREIEEMTIEDMEAEIRETNAIIRKRRRAGTGLLPMPLALLMCLMVSSVDGFTAYHCSNWSNVVEAYSLLEPDACANMGKEGEVETTVYGEIVQIKQDRMIPLFRCIVIETLVAQYCGMISATGVTRYIRFRELKPLEAWECRQARLNSQIHINGKVLKGKIGATASHSMYLTGGLDDESRCEVGIVTLPDGKVLNGQVAQGLYEITLRKEFVRLNELTGSLTLTSGGAGGGRRQEYHRQPRGNGGVGVRLNGLWLVVGPMIFFLSLMLLVWGGLRLMVTVLVRVVVIVRCKGCGIWVLTALWGTLFQLAISPFSWMDAAMEGVGVRVGQMMETKAAREPEEERPKRKSLSIKNLRKKYSWWPSGGGKEEQPAPLIDVEAGEEDGATLRGVKSTKL
jgi:hypothetical protein